jgi:opacity protein-like surface antigen
MKKVKLIFAAAAVLGLFSSSAVYADGFAPGEGLYLGGFGGVGVGIVQPKVTAEGSAVEANVAGANTTFVDGTYEAAEGGIGLAGMEGGAWLGYGYKMGDLYAGLEGEWAGGDVEFKLTSSNPIELDGNTGNTKTITEVKATKEWTGGAFGRLGYYVNDDTLLSFRGGVLVSKFEVTTAGQNNIFSETFYGGGPSFGGSLTSRIAAIDPNLSVRIGAVYTDFLTASVLGLGTNIANRATDRSGHDSEVTGSALSARIGLTYSFFDVNSLF